MAREKERDGAQERRVGGRKERHYRASVSQQVDRASGCGCYCTFPSLYCIHPEVCLILSDIMPLILELFF